MKNKVCLLVPLVGVVLFLSACDQGDDRLIRKAQIESEEASKIQVAEENNNRIKWIERAEKELRLRHRFYEAISGVYKGIAAGNGTTFNIRFTVSSSLPSYPESDRTRTIEEVTADLNNLFINVHEIFWFKSGVASGCVFKDIRPDMKNGKINLVSKECDKSFYLSFDEGIGEINQENLSIPETTACKKIASNVRLGKIAELDAFSGTFQTSLGGNIFRFRAERVFGREEPDRF